MKDFFIGPLLHWMLLIAIVVVLYALGSDGMHTSDFNLFSVIVLLLVAAVVVIVTVTYREDQRITRERPDTAAGHGGESGSA